MKYEMNPNIDREGYKNAQEAQQKTVEEIQVEMGERYKTILEKIANDRPLDVDEQAMLDSMKEKFAH